MLAGEALGDPKSADGAAEMVRVLRVARTSAVRARAKAATALHDLIVTAPAPLREQLTGLYKDRLIGNGDHDRHPRWFHQHTVTRRTTP